MACNPEALRDVPLFGLLDDEELAVLAGQVEIKKFAPRQRIYKMGDPGGRAYVMISGKARLSTVDEDQQEEVIEKESTFPERVADAVAHFGGSWKFIIAFAVVLVVYTAVNSILGRHGWDPYPFILLNLFLSMLAAVQAPVIMMSQNRQDTKDRLRGELDFDVNRRAESEIQGLSRKVNHLTDKLGDIEDLLRAKLAEKRGDKGRG